MHKNIPNILTIFRIVLVPFFIYAYNINSFNWALYIFIIASITDCLDGNIARKYNLVSDFGKFMDPLADKILTCSAFCLFVASKSIPAYWLIIILSREFAVAGIRMLAATKGKVIAADIFGKIKTVLQMIGICFMLLASYLNNLEILSTLIVLKYLFTVAYIIILLSVISTVISGALYIINNKEVFQ